LYIPLLLVDCSLQSLSRRKIIPLSKLMLSILFFSGLIFVSFLFASWFVLVMKIFLGLIFLLLSFASVAAGFAQYFMFVVIFGGTPAPGFLIQCSAGLLGGVPAALLFG
tara:strand:+ start:1655 stop:1981 length:327 start_codon:yes stop_codon:yes gene_type:complete